MATGEQIVNLEESQATAGAVSNDSPSPDNADNPQSVLEKGVATENIPAVESPKPKEALNGVVRSPENTVLGATADTDVAINGCSIETGSVAAANILANGTISTKTPNQEIADSEESKDKGALTAGPPTAGQPSPEDAGENVGYETDNEKESYVRENLSREVNYLSLSMSLEERKKTGQKRSLQASQYLVLLEDRLRDLEEIVKGLQNAKSDGRIDDPEKDKKDKDEKKGTIRPEAVRRSWEDFFAPMDDVKEKVSSAIELLVEAPCSLMALNYVTNGPKRKPGHDKESLDKKEDAPVQRIRWNSRHLAALLSSILGDDNVPWIAEDQLKPFKAIVPYVELIVAKQKELEESLAALPTAKSPPATADQPQATKPAADPTAITRGKPAEGADTKDPDDADSAPTAMGVRTKIADPSTIKAESGISPGDAPTTLPDDKKNTMSADALSEKEEEIERERERDDLTITLEHLKVLRDCFDTSLSSEISLHKQLRSRHKDRDSSQGPPKVSFADLWHVFAPGDIVYDPAETQALQVIAVQGGRQFLVQEKYSATDSANCSLHDGPSRPPPRDYYRDDLDRDAQPFGAVDQKSDFVLSCYYLDFNGVALGPVSRQLSIEPFDGSREITNLPTMPIEYADTQIFKASREGAGQVMEPDQTMQQFLLSRGRKFAELARKDEVTHRDYRGFSRAKVREQIDSQVIIDLGLYYQWRPDDAPVFGLREPPEPNPRELQESYRRMCRCSSPLCSVGCQSLMFDDYTVDKFRTKEFMNKHQYLVRYTDESSQRHLSTAEDCVILFPQTISGFVLRRRDWAPLNVSNITELSTRGQSFDELVLPDEHKKIVAGLVKTHSRGQAPVKNALGHSDVDRRDDLVRGKGKGVVFLLHGVPGVGKTSTAECVAEYTNRPLFALTCGDIGDKAHDVEQSLNTNFQLAHRWGCVMLLDEAEVFLQSRGRERDLSRNAVVSVFLSMLEYYSGILFLTTNKVGTFDEAFKSRIHVSLYYKELDRNQTMKIWKLNLDRIRKTRENISFDEDDMMKWMKKLYKGNEKAELRPWNGRQIRNACQTVAALAEFKNEGKITTTELDAVAKVSTEFDRYLMATHGKDDIGRAEDAVDRGDYKYELSLLQALDGIKRSGSKSRRRDKKGSGRKKSSGKKGKSKKKDAESSSSGSSSSSDSGDGSDSH